MMSVFFHGGDLGTGTLIVLCLIGVGGFLAITLGLAYFAGYLAKKHGERYGKENSSDDGEKANA